MEFGTNSILTASAGSVKWVMSPLRRCIQTFLLSCPLLPETNGDMRDTKSEGMPVKPSVQEKLAALQGSTLPTVRIVRCVRFFPM
jgi:hypothetical protein